MRITERSPQRLVLKDQTIWITALCFAAAGFLAGYAILGTASASMGSAAANGPWVTAVLFAIFGLGFLRTSVVEFDQASGLCKVSKLNVFKRTRLSIPFTDIQDVKIEVEPLNVASERENYALSLVTSSRIVPLSSTYEPGIGHFDEIRAAILEILSRPETPSPDPVQSLVQQGRIVDAVALLRQRDNLDLTTARQRVAEIQKATNRD